MTHIKEIIDRKIQEKKKKNSSKQAVIDIAPKLNTIMDENDNTNLIKSLSVITNSIGAENKMSGKDKKILKTSAVTELPSNSSKSQYKQEKSIEDKFTKNEVKDNIIDKSGHKEVSKIKEKERNKFDKKLKEEVVEELTEQLGTYNDKHEIHRYIKHNSHIDPISSHYSKIYPHKKEYHSDGSGIVHYKDTPLYRNSDKTIVHIYKSHDLASEKLRNIFNLNDNDHMHAHSKLRDGEIINTKIYNKKHNWHATSHKTEYGHAVHLKPQKGKKTMSESILIKSFLEFQKKHPGSTNFRHAEIVESTDKKDLSEGLRLSHTYNNGDKEKTANKVTFDPSIFNEAELEKISKFFESDINESIINAATKAHKFSIPFHYSHEDGSSTKITPELGKKIVTHLDSLNPLEKRTKEKHFNKSSGNLNIN